MKKEKYKVIFSTYKTIGKSLINFEIQEWSIPNKKTSFAKDSQVWNDYPPERITDIRWHLRWYSIILRIETLLSREEAEQYGYNWEKGEYQNIIDKFEMLEKERQGIV